MHVACAESPQKVLLSVLAALGVVLGSVGAVLLATAEESAAARVVESAPLDGGASGRCVLLLWLAGAASPDAMVVARGEDACSTARVGQDVVVCYRRSDPDRRLSLACAARTLLELDVALLAAGWSLAGACAVMLCTGMRWRAGRRPPPREDPPPPPPPPEGGHAPARADSDTLLGWR